MNIRSIPTLLQPLSHRFIPMGDPMCAKSEQDYSLGVLAASMAHDINNALTLVKTALYRIREQVESGETPALASLDLAETVIDRTATLTHRFLAAAHRNASLSDPIDLGCAVSEAGPLLGILFGKGHGLNMNLTGEPLWVDISQSAIDQILVNLAINARDAMPRGGNVHITLIHECCGGLRQALLTFQDEGSGMEPDVQSRMFEPFFTTKPPGHGTGLGLPSVRHLVEAAGGSIRVDSSEGRGTRVVMRFPIISDFGGQMQTSALDEEKTQQQGPASL